MVANTIAMSIHTPIEKSVLTILLGVSLLATPACNTSKAVKGGAIGATAGAGAGAVIGNQLGPCAAAEDIEELASDVFVALWRALQPLRTEHLRGWLGKVARNQAISFLRRQHMQLVRDEDCILVDDRDAQKLLEAKERSALLNAALAALTSEDREIFLRRYYYNQTTGQIAEALHMNPSTVRSRLLRGRQALRTELQKGDVQIEDLCAEPV